MVRVYLKSGPSLPGPSLPGPSLLVLNKMCQSTDNTVSRAREYSHIANREYEENPNKINQHNNTESRNKLYTAYTNSAIDTLEKIKKIENADLNRKYLLSWELINEITDRKTTQKGLIKVKNIYKLGTNTCRIY